ncbi:ATP synthase F1 subunit epsilon [Acuticoccus sp.]|uniref:ATP synthase F1 subunit epsilon n=1 Tax=Acuticoccus sp. TaxID=1904378 RepID=UPI003B52BCC7
MPFPFEIVSPERLLFSGDVEAVRLPGAEGEFQVMADHAPLLALLGPGIMEVTGGGTSGDRLFIDGGFCDMNGRSCTVLAEAATRVQDLSGTAMDALISEAEEEVSQLESPSDRDDANRRLARLRAVRSTL